MGQLTISMAILIGKPSISPVTQFPCYPGWAMLSHWASSGFELLRAKLQRQQHQHQQQGRTYQELQHEQPPPPPPHHHHHHHDKQTNKQTNKQTSKQTNEQPTKEPNNTNGNTNSNGNSNSSNSNNKNIKVIKSSNNRNTTKLTIIFVVLSWNHPHGLLDRYPFFCKLGVTASPLAARSWTWRLC